MRYLGIDLAWSDGPSPNETGLVALDASGRVLDAGWARGVDEVVDWTTAHLGPAIAAVDASLLVTNPAGQRTCEKQVGQRYGRWRVSANSTNTGTRHLAGAVLLRRLESCGWAYDDGHDGPPHDGRTVVEVYPYTTLVGTEELGYHATERPAYKRRPRAVGAADFRPVRATVCDDLVRRVARLRHAHPPMDLLSHPVTARLVQEPSPLDDRAYKHREDLLDAALCAWTAALWHVHGAARVQVLGDPREGRAKAATILAPAVHAQRRVSG